MSDVMNKIESYIVIGFNKAYDDGEIATQALLKVGPCLYSRHTCSLKDLHYVYEKMGVYAYEHGISLKKENITVYLNESENEITADVFIPIV